MFWELGAHKPSPGDLNVYIRLKDLERAKHRKKNLKGTEKTFWQMSEHIELGISQIP